MGGIKEAKEVDGYKGRGRDQRVRDEPRERPSYNAQCDAGQPTEQSSDRLQKDPCVACHRPALAGRAANWDSNAVLTYHAKF